jgi:hypothetical protein
MLTGLYDKPVMGDPAQKQTPPAITPAGLARSLSDIRPDSRYGLSPIVPFRL